MPNKKNYLGHLMVSNPKNPKDELGDRSVILVVTHSENIAIGLQINRPSDDLDLASISKSLGVDFDANYPVFYGGNTTTAKIHMIHSLDWTTASTVKITDNIGVTNDISVLKAIASNQGPKCFRACAGYWWWENALLNQMLDPKLFAECPVPYRWETVPATIDTVFLTHPDDQWNEAIEQSTKFLVDCYF
jgi:putative AlgH/UPF0301 family transcriptional regulator